MQYYYEQIVRGTAHEDSLVILQKLKEQIGKKFSFLNYYKEIPVTYGAKLLSVENEMAEFEVHEYQAKVIKLEKKALLTTRATNGFLHDVFGEAFYANSAKSRVILCKFSYARILSVNRRYVRVRLDRKVSAELISDADVMQGKIIDLSLGGAAIVVDTKEQLVPGSEHNLFLKLPDSMNTIKEIGLAATVVSVLDDTPPYTCVFEFHPDHHSQQQIAYFINQRQVEIIKELKELKS